MGLVRRKSSLRTKIHLLGSVLFIVLMLVGGTAIFSAYRSIKSELFYWFDLGGHNLVTTIARESLEHVFPYYEPSLDAYMQATLEKDPNLAFIKVQFGDDLSENRTVGAPASKGFRVYQYSISDNTGSPICGVTIHCLTSGVESKLAWLWMTALVSVLVSFVVFVMLLDVFLTRYVTKPLAALAESSRRVSGGELNHDVAVVSDDEVAQVAQAFNLMTRNLRTTVEKIRILSDELARIGEHTGEISTAVSSDTKTQVELLSNISDSIGRMDGMLKSTAENVENLFDAIEQSAGSTMEMTASIGQVGKTSEELARSVDTYAAAVEESAASVATVADGVSILDEQVARTSEEISKIDSSLHAMSESAKLSGELTSKVAEMVTRDGQESVSRAMAGFSKIREVVGEAVDSINTLGNQAEGIGSVIDVISDLAEQTNLLSLNAAIIAAQAGEQGRAFAVVADEIRELAERTGSYLDEISRNIRGVQGMAAQAAAIVNRSSRTVDEGVELIGGVDQALKKVAADSTEASHAAQAIAEAAAISAESSANIAAAARRMANMSREITTATSEQSQGTAQMLEELAGVHTMSVQLNLAMHEQEGVARMISNAAESAREMTERIRHSTISEGDQSEKIVLTVDRLRDVSHTGMAAVEKLDEMVQRVNASVIELKQHLKNFKT